MRQFVALLVLLGWLVSASAVHSSGDETAGMSGNGACSLLTRELVTQLFPDLPKFMLDYPPQEEALGKSGSACDYAGITLQIDAFTPDFIEQSGNKAADGWQPVAGIGNRAWFRDNRHMFAELIGSVGTRTFTIQLGVPMGGDAETVKPDAIALARAIVPKLE